MHTVGIYLLEDVESERETPVKDSVRNGLLKLYRNDYVSSHSRLSFEIFNEVVQKQYCFALPLPKTSINHLAASIIH